MHGTTPPKLPAQPPAAPAASAHNDRLLTRKRDGDLPGFLKTASVIVGVLGVLGGLILASELPTPVVGIFAGLSALGFAIGIYALGDIVLSLRRIAFNTSRY